MSKDKNTNVQPINVDATEVRSTNTNTSTNTQQNNPLVLPEKVTMVWLVHHVPIAFWLWLAGIIIAIFIVGATVGQTTFIKEILGKKTETSQSQNSKDSSQNSSAKKDDLELKMSEPTPMQIYEEIDKVPPLQRQDVARRYIGIKVDWELIFSSASLIEKDQAVILFDSAPANKVNLMSVRCLVKLSDYQELSIMKSGKKVRVTGTISGIGLLLFVELKDVKLTYLN